MAAIVRRSPRVLAAQQAECHGPGDEASVPGRDGGAGRARVLNVSRCRNVGEAPSDNPGGIARKNGLSVSLVSDNDGVAVMGDNERRGKRTARRSLQAAPSGEDLGRPPNTEGTETEYECGTRGLGETLCPREDQGKAPALGGPSTDSGTKTPTKRGVGAPVQAGVASRTPETTGVLWKSPASVVEVPGPSSESLASDRVVPGPSCEKELNAHIAPGSSCESGTSAPVAAFCSESGAKSSVTASPTIVGHVQDYRVRCFSKQLVQDVLEMCTEFSKELVESQECLSPDQREQELKNCIWNFQTSFQENVVVNGQSWHEATEIENESDLKIIEDRLDDLIVDTTRKRKFHPRKIASHVVKMLKTERDILEQYTPVVTPEEFKLDAGLMSRMADLTTVTSTVSKQISETMKALPSHIEKADGFSQVLSIQPMLEDSRIRREIFSCQVKLDDLAKSRAEPVETTPSANPSPPKTTPFLKRKRQQSPSQQRLYPLRHKKKMSLVT